ncbi:MAG: restriction endonuclease, partial [Spirochaetaceae bacterium]|nr:restriction endonuclease [Spirochaetaceae bacterium]
RAFEQALHNKAYRARALTERGRCYFALDALDKGIQELELAVKIIGDESNRHSLYARYCIASGYERSNQMDKALAQWDKIYEIKQDFLDVEKKRVQYADYRYDVLKDYLNAGEEEFTALCTAMANAMGFAVKETKSIPNGLELIGIEGPEEQIDENENNRALHCLMRFYRLFELVHEDLVYAMLEDIKRANMQRGRIITNSGFAQDARDYAKARAVRLLDKDMLIELLQKIS